MRLFGLFLLTVKGGLVSLAVCIFDRSKDCYEKPKHGVNPCLTCRFNRKQLKLVVFC